MTESSDTQSWFNKQTDFKVGERIKLADDIPHKPWGLQKERIYTVRMAKKEKHDQGQVIRLNEEKGAFGGFFFQRA